MNTAIDQATKLLTHGRTIPRVNSCGGIGCMLSGQATEADMHGFLVALQQKGETVDGPGRSRDGYARSDGPH